MKTEKKYLMYGIGLVLLTLIGVSLAYFATEIVGDKKQVSIGTGDLRVVFTNGEDITGTDIEPGWSVSKTFSIENKTNKSYKYNIVIEDLLNTFKTTGYLVYKITSSDGGYNMTDFKDVPKSSTATDTVLSYSVPIESKTKHNYTIELKYINDINNPQNEDIGTTLSGKLFISEGTEASTLADLILENNPTVSERTDFSVTNTLNTTGTIYKTNKTEDGNYVYYYSGNTTNNWVKFGKEGTCMYEGEQTVYIDFEHEEARLNLNLNECNSTNVCSLGDKYFIGVSSEMCENSGGVYLSEKATWSNEDIYWKIIRTNEDGSVRLLYTGISTDTTLGYISTSAFNSTYNESRYVGYMYGGTSSLADNRTNTTSSTIKGVIDTWYQNNLLESYDKYISKSAIYCNDRSVGSGDWVNTGGSDFYYGAYTRLNTNKAPNYKCGANASNGLFESTQATADKFSASTTGGGNGQLTYPVALITVDEIVFAGGLVGEELSSPYNWYYTNSEEEGIIDGEAWWLLSPGKCSSNDGSFVFAVLGSGYFGALDVGPADFAGAVRPVLSLSSCVKANGSGTPTDPYVLDTTNSTCS